MPVIIGSARSDENGKLTGGKAGDQTGKEVSTQNFYMHTKGWIGLRAIDETTRALLAMAMSEACDNPNIGYDQSQRTSFLPLLRKAGVFRKITTPCEADCSELVRGCCIQAGFDPGDFNTSNEVSVLMETKRFTKFEVKSEKDVQNGDILVTKTKGHTVIVVNANNVPKPSTPVPKPNVSPARYKDVAIGGAYIVTASSLNLRLGPNTTYGVVRTLKNGETVNCYGYFSKTAGKDWYLVQAGNDQGYVSSDHIKKV